MQERNGEPRDGKGRTARAVPLVSVDRRLMGWAVTLFGVALMAAGATLAFL